MKNVILSVVIVTYNNEKDIVPCLFSLPWKHISMEVLLVDNSSTDHTRHNVENFCRQFPTFLIKKFWNQTNPGYAFAINKGLSQSRGDFILLLGPDSRVLSGALEKMINFLKTHPDVGLIAPQLIDANGKVQPSCRRFPTYRDLLFELTGLPRIFPRIFSPHWKMNDFDHNTQKEVDQPEATCLIAPRKSLYEVGFMDKRFPLFFNDVDWCRRFWMKGWKVVFYPAAKVEHKKGTSVYRFRIPAIWKSHQGFYRYFQKYSTSFPQKIINQGLGLLMILAASYRSIGVIFWRNKK